MANVFGMSMKITNSETNESIDFYDDPVVLLTDISGMGLDAEVVTTERACHNGSWYRYTRVPERNITIQATYRPLSFNQVVGKRRQIHDILQPGVKLDIMYNGGWTVLMLDGYAEKCEDTENGNLMVCSISIICPNPFFKGNEETVDLSSDETVVNYTGTVPTGVVVETGGADTVNLTINGETMTVKSALASTPVQQKTFVNSNVVPVDSKAALVMNPIQTCSDEPVLDTSKIIISTLRNEKGVYYGSSDTNYISSITESSLYPELVPGKNIITLTDGNKPIKGKMIFRPLYGGAI